MTRFETKQLPVEADVTAPDGCDVRVLLELPAGSLAHFELPGRATSVAIRHRTISEIWYFVAGVGQMWRSQDGRAEIVDVAPGTTITIPVATAFQFRSSSDDPLTAVGVAMPPWPGDGEAEIVDGIWLPTVDAGPV